MSVADRITVLRNGKRWQPDPATTTPEEISGMTAAMWSR